MHEHHVSGTSDDALPRVFVLGIDLGWTRVGVGDLFRLQNQVHIVVAKLDGVRTFKAVKEHHTVNAMVVDVGAVRTEVLELDHINGQEGDTKVLAAHGGEVGTVTQRCTHVAVAI